MIRFTLYVSFFLLGIISKIQGLATVQEDWVFPQSPDNSSTVDLGSSVTFKWTSNLQNWFPQFLPNGNVSHVDVWVTGMTISKGYHKLAAGFDVKSSTTFSWTNVMVPSSELEEEDVWVLRFVAEGDDILTGTGDQISSPLFFIKDTSKSTTSSLTSATSTSSLASTSNNNLVIASSSTESTPASSTAPTSVTPSSEGFATSITSVSPAADTSIETAVPTSQSTGLSTGAKAGIGIGAGVGVACVFALLACCLVRRRTLKGTSRSHGRVGMDGHEMAPPMEIQSKISHKAW